MAVLLGAALVVTLPAPAHADKAAAARAKAAKVAAAKARERPASKRWQALLAESVTIRNKRPETDLKKLREALIREKFEPAFEHVCIVAPNDRITCADFSSVTGLLDEADRSFMNLGTRDLNDVLGGTGQTNTLVACAGGGLASATHIIPMDGGAMPRQGKTGAVSPNPAATAAMLDGCRRAQVSDIRSGLGALAPGDPGYARAIQNVVGAMDAALAACQDGKNDLISQPGGGGAPAAGSTPPSGAPPPSAAPSAAAPASGAPPATPPPTENVPEKALQAVTLAAGFVGALVSTAQAITGGKKEFVAAAIAAVSTTAGFVGVSTPQGNQVADIAGNSADIVGGVMEMNTAAAAAAAGTSTGALGAALPVAAAFGLGYAGWRLSNTVLGGALDRGAVAVVGVHTDAYFAVRNGTPLFRPSEDGKPSCADMQARWAAFKAYCDAPGNAWQTYDCMLFVARGNACADPALVNPGPEGDYTCRAKNSDAERNATFACEQRRKLGNLIKIVTSEGLDCARGGSRFDHNDLITKSLCQRVTPTPDGSGNCPAPPRHGR